MDNEEAHLRFPPIRPSGNVSEVQVRGQIAKKFNSKGFICDQVIKKRTSYRLALWTAKTANAFSLPPANATTGRSNLTISLNTEIGVASKFRGLKVRFSGGVPFAVKKQSKTSATAPALWMEGRSKNISSARPFHALSVGEPIPTKAQSRSFAQNFFGLTMPSNSTSLRFPTCFHLELTIVSMITFSASAIETNGSWKRERAYNFNRFAIDGKDGWLRGELGV